MGDAAVPAGAVARARWLPLVVVVGGAASLAIEMCAERLLAPYFGNSTIVWANVIGLILVYLSVGYWLGGRIADRHTTRQALGTLLAAGAAATGVLPFAARPFLSLALQAFAALNAGAVVGSFFGTLVLFAIPVSLLGMVSPFAIRLAVTDVRHAGSVAGRLSSLATIGAIAGTFGAALVLVPAIGTQRTLLVAALAVALAALPLFLRLSLPVAVALAVLIALPPGAVKPQIGVVAERETQYQYIAVVREADGKLVMRFDDGIADQSVYRSWTPLTGGEWDMPVVVPPLMSRGLRDVLIIGNAGGTTARVLAAEYPGVRIDAVELDPVVTQLARQYMGLGAIPRLHVVTADGRAYLETSAQRYDLIVVDAYRQTYIPFYMATQEFFSLLHAHLNAGGAVALNVERVPGDDRLVQAVAGTLAAVMPQTWVWPALRFNELVLGLDRAVTPGSLAVREAALPPAVSALGPLVVREAYREAPSQDPMTDDRAPVEWLTDRAVLAYIAEGGRLNEALLPTAP